MTRNQKIADAFDCDLFALMDRADRYADARSRQCLEWAAVRDHLNRARGIVRSMMDEKRRAETAG